MKCPKCGSEMTPGKACPNCDTVKIKVPELMQKPVDSQNQVRNITDEIDPDLHRKPEK